MYAIIGLLTGTLAKFQELASFAVFFFLSLISSVRFHPVPSITIAKIKIPNFGEVRISGPDSGVDFRNTGSSGIRSGFWRCPDLLVLIRSSGN